jgi:glutamate synthase (NADPH/NADH) small chain
MGAGRQAARSMKAYLGIRDIDFPYASEGRDSTNKLFGIDLKERNFARVRVAAAAKQ